MLYIQSVASVPVRVAYFGHQDHSDIRFGSTCERTGNDDAMETDEPSREVLPQVCVLRLDLGGAFTSDRLRASALWNIVLGF